MDHKTGDCRIKPDRLLESLRWEIMVFVKHGERVAGEVVRNSRMFRSPIRTFLR